MTGAFTRGSSTHHTRVPLRSCRHLQHTGGPCGEMPLRVAAILLRAVLAGRLQCPVGVNQEQEMGEHDAAPAWPSLLGLEFGTRQPCCEEAQAKWRGRCWIPTAQPLPGAGLCQGQPQPSDV
uniref:Unnamed protein product n=1 Tax=Macaca fascicularis TaxID=9541 RepID=Q9N0A2_MACFA|nr:unnamed protein product [Macaca fascicularis]